MQEIKWGIIGCGDVMEIKSGPAFSKVPQSCLVAVMRRDADKAADYAKRHHVPKWYSDAYKLISDPEVNAVYIATPPDSHMEYAIAAMQAGKPVYVEKPMASTYASALKIANIAEEAKVKLVVAHYRRQWPLFKKLKKLIDENAIGNVQLVQLKYFKPPLTTEELKDPKIAWRVDPAIAGGGLFHDLAPHQLDILYYLFGEATKINGVAANQAGIYKADDIVSGNILFANAIVFNGTWYFNANEEIDTCLITGSKGSINFGFFSGNTIVLENKDGKKVFAFDRLEHVQQPMIEQTVQYLLGNAENPCSGREGAEIMRWMQEMTRK